MFSEDYFFFDLERVQKRVNLVKPPSEIGSIQAKFLKGLKDSLLTSGRTGYVFTPFLL